MASTAKPWAVEFTRTAEKQIKKLDRVARQRIAAFLRKKVRPSGNPRQWGKALHGDKADLWRYRVGDYRLICEIQDKEITVLVLHAEHRKDVYR